MPPSLCFSTLFLRQGLTEAHVFGHTDWLTSSKHLPVRPSVCAQHCHARLFDVGAGDLHALFLGLHLWMWMPQPGAPSSRVFFVTSPVFSSVCSCTHIFKAVSLRIKKCQRCIQYISTLSCLSFLPALFAQYNFITMKRKLTKVWIF